MSKIISLWLLFAKLVGWTITKKNGFSDLSAKTRKAFFTGFNVLVFK